MVCTWSARESARSQPLICQRHARRGSPNTANKSNQLILLRIYLCIYYSQSHRALIYDGKQLVSLNLAGDMACYVTHTPNHVHYSNPLVILLRSNRTPHPRRPSDRAALIEMYAHTCRLQNPAAIYNDTNGNYGWEWLDSWMSKYCVWKVNKTNIIQTPTISRYSILHLLFLHYNMTKTTELTYTILYIL